MRLRRGDGVRVPTVLEDIKCASGPKIENIIMKEHTLGEFEELVLLMVAALHDQAYGVLILESLEEKLKKKFNISAVHVALKRLDDKGFVKSRFGGITADRGGRRKKYYVITALGKKVLDNQYALRTSIYAQIPKISFS
jgi:PadR family transcriptional regulator, regulatory protein PadR